MMRRVTPSKLVSLQKSPGHVRNICVLAHVDHGKTTLCDSLVASNGVISSKQAGKLRYMDSRKDEQERGITMKSSSIALHHQMENGEEFLVNLIDSPGHVDFSAEVTTAVRLCDGAIIVVDVVEGVCAQTIVALGQAWKEDIKPVLVLNKIDRLILERKLTELDAYVHLQQVLEKVNAVMAELMLAELGKGMTHPQQSRSRGSSLCTNEPEQNVITTERDINAWSTGLDDIDDSQLYFSPELGNVIFATALDGWGFRVSEFAKIVSQEHGFSEKALNATLWGDYFINAKKTKIMKGAQEKAKIPLFVEYVLKSIWAMYDAIIRKNTELVSEKIVSLKLSVHPRELKQTDPKLVLHAVMSKWLPLSRVLLDVICTKLPSPLELSKKKVDRLLLTRSRQSDALIEKERIKDYFIGCNSSENAPTIVFVSKMFPADSQSLPENRPRILTPEEMMARREQAKERIAQKAAAKAENSNTDNEPVVDTLRDNNDNHMENVQSICDDKFIAFARVYSGTLKRGDKLYVLGPKYNPVEGVEKLNGVELNLSTTLKDLKAGEHVTAVIIKSLYLLMGRDLEAVDEVPAGNIVGIGGVEDHILKTATISSTLACPPFTEMTVFADPILRVAIEPVKTADMAALVHGLRLLNQADPCVQIVVQEGGEYVLITAGEVHLQRCVDDLRERYAKVQVSMSQPIVPFRETIVEPPKVDMVNEIIEGQQNQPHDGAPKENADGSIIQVTPNKKCKIKLRAKALPTEVTERLEKAAEILGVIKDTSATKQSRASSLSEDSLKEILELKDFLTHAFKKSGWEEGIVDRIWNFGPNKVGPNILVNNIPDYRRGSVWPTEEAAIVPQATDPRTIFSSNFESGFQQATSAGPLCKEPMSGVAFLVEEWSVEEAEDAIGQTSGSLSGQIMSSMKDACRKAFELLPQRLRVAMFSCSIQVNSEVLGKLYAVLGKRGGRILHGDLQEGSANFEVTALLPVIESFDFANEVRHQTSGLAMPQLIFAGWETLEIDPFWIPTTEEEYLHFGEKADSENRARKYMNAVRKRKGLRVEEKIVEFGEKQRTLTRNK